MPLHFNCNHCGQKLSVSSSKAGLRTKCPKCSQPIKIPGKPATVAAASGAATQSAPKSTEKKVEEKPPAAPPRSEKVATRAPAPEVASLAESAASPIEETAPPPPVENSVETAAPPELPVVDPSPAPDEAAPAEPSFPEFTNYDEQAEWVYVEEDQADAASVVDPTKLAVPRWVLYAQGGLLGGVAMLAFLLGFFAGGAGAGPVRNGPPEPRPVAISGKISYQVASRKDYADDGAVIIVLPQSAKPNANEKIAINGLRPADNLPPEDHRGLSLVRELGGGYARTDGKGEFRVRLPDAGKYYVLILSKNGERKDKSDVNIKKAHLAEIGRYFESALDLLGTQRFRWLTEDVYKDRRLELTLTLE